MNMLFKYLERIPLTYSSVDSGSILTAGIISAGVIFLCEIAFAVILIQADKNQKLKHKALFISSFSGIRSFIRFVILYSFLMSIKSSSPPEYPMNIIHRGIELAILYAGAAAAVFKIMKVLKKRNSTAFSGTPLTLKLVKVSERGIRISILLLLIGLFFRQLRGSFSAELQGELWMSLIVLFSSILLTIALLVAVEKILPPLQKLIKQPSGFNAVKSIVSIISTPLRLLILTLFFLSVKSLITKPEILTKLLTMVMNGLFSASLLLFFYNSVEILISRLSKYSELETNSLDKTLIEMIRMIVRVAFIAAFFFIIIRIVTGKPMTTLLAGLGIGGLAVALAAQDTLKNFFGSIMIMTDKPFKVGERVLAEGYDGTVESIGFRSTRIRTLTGHQVVIPNDKVAQAAIENIGRRPSIRRLTNITITYNTPPEKVEKALAIIREILENHEGMMEDLPPRVYFSEFNTDSLNILMLYWYSPPNYWDYMRFSEEVNLRIMKGFAAEGIEFAFPTHTTYLEQEDGKSIKLDIPEFLKK